MKMILKTNVGKQSLSWQTRCHSSFLSEFRSLILNQSHSWSTNRNKSRYRLIFDKRLELI